MSLEDQRAEINNLDSELLRLLNRRARIALKVGESKQASGLSLCDHTREREVIDRMCQANEGPLDDRAIIELYRVIIHESRRIQTRVEQSTVDGARSCDPGRTGRAWRFRVNPAPSVKRPPSNCSAIRKSRWCPARRLTRSLAPSSDAGRRSTYWRPLKTASLVLCTPAMTCSGQRSVHQSAKSSFPISHCLIGCPGATFETITTVESHPVALEQCRRFLGANPQIKRVCRRRIRRAAWRAWWLRVIRPRAAIAGRRAAEAVRRSHPASAFGGQQRELHAVPFAHAEPLIIPADADKLSMVIELPHHAGALHDALEPFARRDIDLLKIEGRPVKGRPWEYCFYLDLRGSANDRKSLARSRNCASGRVEVRILGSYASARVPGSAGGDWTRNPGCGFTRINADLNNQSLPVRVFLDPRSSDVNRRRFLMLKNYKSSRGHEEMILILTPNIEPESDSLQTINGSSRSLAQHSIARSPGAGSRTIAHRDLPDRQHLSNPGRRHEDVARCRSGGASVGRVSRAGPPQRRSTVRRILTIRD